MWGRGKGDTEAAKGKEWVVAGRYSASDGGVDADMAVAELKAKGIPAMRFPTQAVAIYVPGLPSFESVRVLVPPDRLEEAREVLVEEIG